MAYVAVIMPDTVKNRVHSAIQHAFCREHYAELANEFWREINEIVKFWESTKNEIGRASCRERVCQYV